MYENMTNEELRHELRNMYGQMRDSCGENGTPKMGKAWYTDQYWPMLNEWEKRTGSIMF